MRAVPFGETLPDVQSKPPKRMFAAEGMLLPFSTDVGAVGGGDFVSYIYVLTAVGLPERKPVCFVTLESSPFAANQLCAFDQDGCHLSYGALEGDALEDNFLKAAFEIVQEHTGPLNQLQEVTRKVRREPPEAKGVRSAWNVFSAASVGVVLAADMTFLVMALKQGQIGWALVGSVTPIGIVVGMSWWWHWFWQYLRALLIQ